MIAQAVINQFDFEHVLFIPAGTPPHRQTETDMASALDRFNMVRLATAYHPRFRVSRVEVDKSGPSYTSETLSTWFPSFGKAGLTKIPMILGTDALALIGSWHEAEALINSVTFYQAPRPETPLVKTTKFNGAEVALDTVAIDMPPFATSSTWIREQIQIGKDIHPWVHPDVRRYILANHLWHKA